MIGVLFLIFLTTILFYNFYWKRRKLPPGPTPLPIIGNILSLSLDKDPYNTYLKWHKKYGPIHTFWMGEKPIVSITNFNLMKETFIKDGDSYTGRDVFQEFFRDMRGGIYGVFGVDGEFWKNQRRFALHVLRDFGMGRNVIENIINHRSFIMDLSEFVAKLKDRVLVMKEVDRLIKWADLSINSGNRVVCMRSIVEICVGSVINSALLGYRFAGENESEFYRLRKFLTEGGDLLGDPLVMLMTLSNSNCWKWLPFFKSSYNRLAKNFLGLMEFFDQQIAKNQKLFSSDLESVEEATNYVQAFLAEMKRRERNGVDMGEFTLEQLKGVLMDLWAAGQDTTSTTTRFGILYLTAHPEVQNKLQIELDNKVGSERKVILTDRPKLHYTNAVISEIQRLCNLLPLNILHKTSQDVHINGYTIKKGTTIVPQICAVLFDEKIFPQPRKFMPERFLDENGCFKKAEELVPFSLGKRVCLGESLARDELFLLLANLFHEFKVMPADPKNQPILEKSKGLAVRPANYKVQLKRRINLID